VSTKTANNLREFAPNVSFQGRFTTVVKLILFSLLKITQTKTSCINSTLNGRNFLAM